MRELVFNERCVPGNFASLEEAVSVSASLIKGLRDLVAAQVVGKAIRLHANAEEIHLGSEITLRSVMVALLKSRDAREQGIFFAALTQKIPIDAGLEDSIIDSLLGWEVDGTLGCYSLLLCALQNQVAISLSANELWGQDQITLVVVGKDGAKIIRDNIIVDHLSQQRHAPLIIERHQRAAIAKLEPHQFWNQRAELFADLRFGLDVEGQIGSLSKEDFRSALHRLFELDGAVRRWKALETPNPPYASKVTGESEATMNQFGRHRVFQDHEGRPAIFERHARIANGNRIHLLEHRAHRWIEIGYIGPHLPTVDFPK